MTTKTLTPTDLIEAGRALPDGHLYETLKVLADEDLDFALVEGETIVTNTRVGTLTIFPADKGDGFLILTAQWQYEALVRGKARDLLMGAYRVEAS